MERFGTAPEKNEYSDASYLKMYEIPGQETITEHGFLRYIKDKKQDEEIKNLIHNSVNNFRGELASAYGDQLIDLILRGLENKNPQIQILAADYIWEVPKKQLTNLILQGLENKNPKVQKSAFESISKLPPEKITDFIILGLNHPNSQVQIVAASNIYLSPEINRESLIQKGLENSNVLVKIVSLGNISFLSENDRLKIVNQCLDFDTNLLKKVIYHIMPAPGEDPELEQNITNRAWLGLESPDINTQIDAAGLIHFSAKEEIPKLQQKIAEIIKHELKNPDIKIQKSIIDFFEYLSDLQFPELRTILFKKIEEGLRDSNIEVQRIALSMASGLLPDKRKEIFELAIKQGLGEELIKPPLYKNRDINSENFSRHQFDKTGSGTTLIGGALKDKTIIRHIEPEAFLSWQKIYENHELWKEYGFDYVPIEPMISYKLNKNGLVDVHSGVLDLSFDQWRRKSSLFVSELCDERDAILKALDEQNINHGHAHDDNFCLRFFRDSEGKVDFTKKPRLYLIDFDQAISPI